MHAALAADDAPVDPAPIDRERTEQRLRAHEAHRRLDLAQHVGALRVRLVLDGHTPPGVIGEPATSSPALKIYDEQIRKGLRGVDDCLGI